MYEVSYELLRDGIWAGNFARLEDAESMSMKLARRLKFELGVDSVTFKIKYNDKILKEYTIEVK